MLSSPVLEAAQSPPHPGSLLTIPPQLPVPDLQSRLCIGQDAEGEILIYLGGLHDAGLCVGPDSHSSGFET